VNSQTRYRALLHGLRFLVCTLMLSSCAPRWEISATLDGQSLEPIRASLWTETAEELPDEQRDDGALPLERLIWESRVIAVESVTVGVTSYAWEEVHDEAWIDNKGCIIIGDTAFENPTLEITSPPETQRVGAQIIDLAPTVAGALGVSSPEKTTGRALGAYESDHVVMIFLDGLGYRQYMSERGTGITPFLDTLQGPRLAHTVYPSITRASTAAMITGTTPDLNGIRGRNQRSTDVETFFDTVTEAGKRSVAVEGDALAFNLSNADVILSGDRDGNGHTDDNTYANAIDVIHSDIPDLLWIHFHGIDDVGHAYGPDSEQVLTKMTEVDGYVQNLCLALPKSTLVLIFSDHGMHAVDEGERRGNHGSLLAQDMFVPIWAVML